MASSDRKPPTPISDKARKLTVPILSHQPAPAFDQSNLSRLLQEAKDALQYLDAVPHEAPYATPGAHLLPSSIPHSHQLDTDDYYTPTTLPERPKDLNLGLTSRIYRAALDAIFAASHSVGITFDAKWQRNPPPMPSPIEEPMTDKAPQTFADLICNRLLQDNATSSAPASPKDIQQISEILAKTIPEIASPTPIAAAYNAAKYISEKNLDSSAPATALILAFFAIATINLLAGPEIDPNLIQADHSPHQYPDNLTASQCAKLDDYAPFHEWLAKAISQDIPAALTGAHITFNKNAYMQPSEDPTLLTAVIIHLFLSVDFEFIPGIFANGIPEEYFFIEIKNVFNYHEIRPF